MQGRLSAIAGDTITLSPLTIVEYFGARDPKCEGGRALRFERTVNDRMTVRAFSPTRTGVLVLALAALAAVIASSPGPGIGGGLGGFCPDGC